MKHLLLVLFLGLFLVGCASSGKKFTINQANIVENGMTREEVISIMGSKPYSISEQGKVFVWSFSKMNLMGGTESRAVRFSFDENGKTYGVPNGGVFGDTSKYQD